MVNRYNSYTIFCASSKIFHILSPSNLHDSGVANTKSFKHSHGHCEGPCYSVFIETEGFFVKLCFFVYCADLRANC